MIQIASSTDVFSNSFNFDINQTCSTQSQVDLNTSKIAHSILANQNQTKICYFTSASSSKSNTSPLNHLLNNPYSFDEILNLLDEVESGEVEKKYSPEELKRIEHFMVHLARQGTSPDNSKENTSLEDDIEELFNHEENPSYPGFFGNQEDNMNAPAAYPGGGQAALYKSGNGWVKRKSKGIGSFVKKHKKAIIIGAIIVAIVATIVIIALAASSAAAGGAALGASAGGTSSGGSGAAVGGVSAAGAGAAKTLSDKSDKQKIDAQKQKEEKSNSDLTVKPVNSNQSPTLESAFNEKVSKFKKTAEKDLSNLPHFAKGHENAAMEETLRNLGSNFAHEALDEVAGFFGVVPQFFEEAKELGHKILPESILPRKDTAEITPKKNFEALVASGHEKIDQIFSTEKASYYGPDAKKPYGGFKIGVIPLPGGIPKLFSNTSYLIKAGNVIDRAGFTKVGRGLMKHGYRLDSNYPKPVGNPAQVNEQGQKMLESILNHPNKEYVIYESKRLGKTIDIYAPGVGAVRYTPDGDFIGFLELKK